MKEKRSERRVTVEYFSTIQIFLRLTSSVDNSVSTTTLCPTESEGDIISEIFVNLRISVVGVFEVRVQVRNVCDLDFQVSLCML